MNRFTLGLLIGLVALPARAEMTEAEREALHAEIRAYLLENPEVLVDAMAVLQEREDVAALERDKQLIVTQSDAVFLSAQDWVGGNPEGDVTLVEFMDYRCGYCRKAYDEVEALIEADGNIRFVVKEFPILGEASLLSSQFAIAVLQLHGPETYEKVHDELIALRGEPTPETLSRLASDLGLDPKPIIDRMPGAEVRAVIEANYALAEAMDISGTPAFITPAGVMRGYAPLETMQEFVAAARNGG
ncbi:MAG TPA: DsbA family protein [Tabrizicola sp.]|nr:DsbA family protein [Tabrizicola sp.]